MSETDEVFVELKEIAGYFAIFPNWDLADATVKRTMALIADLTNQRDRLRELLETMVSISPYGQEWRAICQEAREALKGEGS